MRKSAPLFCALLLSLSARRAWIEIGCWLPDHSWWLVALRKESVDRNSTVSASSRACTVALRKESVDRNKALPSFPIGGVDVALRKESVDRNIPPIPTSQTSSRSLSARRAWIEIASHKPACRWQESLSARRAWIEITALMSPDAAAKVALRKESVDRNPQ